MPDTADTSKDAAKGQMPEWAKNWGPAGVVGLLVLLSQVGLWKSPDQQAKDQVALELRLASIEQKLETISEKLDGGMSRNEFEVWTERLASRNADINLEVPEMRKH